MKKSRRILLLCGALLILLCFVGCTQASVDASEPVGTESQTESTDSVISDLSSQTDSTGNSIPENAVLFENDIYCIERIDGACYLTFREGKEPRELNNNGCIRHDENIVFKSADNLFNSLACDGLDEYALQQVRTFFIKKEAERYCIVDPYHFLLPVLPGYEKPDSLRLRDDRLSVMYYSSGNTPAVLSPRLKFDFVTKESYEEREARIRGKFISPENSTDTVFYESDRNATVYYESSFGGLRGTRMKYYVLQDGSKTLYVSEEYLLECNTDYYAAEFVSETIPVAIYVYGTDGTSFFSIEGRYLGSRPTVEWLLSIETAPYVPKQ